MHEQGDLLEADLDRFYGIDLNDVYRGNLTLRQIEVRVKALPPDSALVRAANPGGWTVDQILMGLAVDSLRHSAWAYDVVNRAEGSAAPPHPVSVLPQPDTEPSDVTDDEDVPTINPRQLGAFLGGNTT